MSEPLDIDAIRRSIAMSRRKDGRLLPLCDEVELMRKGLENAASCIREQGDEVESLRVRVMELEGKVVRLSEALTSFVCHATPKIPLGADPSLWVALMIDMNWLRTGYIELFPEMEKPLESAEKLFSSGMLEQTKGTEQV